MNQLIGTIVCIAIAALIFAGFWWGWRARVGRQSGLPAPATPPATLGSERIGAEFEGMYVSTTLAGERFERVAAHGLGLRTTARLFVADLGVVIARDGADDLLLPRESLTGARTESGMAGKFVEKDGLVVIGWRLGDTAVDTGFRTRYAEDRPRLMTALEKLELAS